MAANRLRPSLPSSPIRSKIRAPATTSLVSFPSFWLHLPIRFQCPKFSLLPPFPSRETFISSPLPWSPTDARAVFTILAVVDEEQVVTEDVNDDDLLDSELKQDPRPCELYVCNLPRSHDISKLAQMFEPFGTVVSVEVSRNPETGVSRGCGYVTMGSIIAARKAIAALDGSDVGGREMRVRLSVDMSSGRRNPELLNSGPITSIIYESPYRIYIGNLAWNTKPVELRKHFSQFGTVVSARVLYDRKIGRTRTYGFLSFSSAAERDAALKLDGTDFRGRILVVKTGLDRRQNID